MFKLKEYHKDKAYSTYAFNIRTPHEYYDSGHCATKYCLLNISLGSRSWWWIIPQIIKPRKKWVDTSKEVWSKNPNGGYWNYIAREYGFTMTEQNLHIHYGIQPGCWSSRDKKNSDHTKVFDIPWKNNTFVGQLFFAPDWAFYDFVKPRNNRGALDFDKLHAVQESVPKFKIKFNDYDGEEIIATCYLTMRKYHCGTSWCKWLKYFTKSVEYYAIEVEYNKETGYEKGSWKGGTMAHGIQLQYGEDPVEAFKRYGSEDDRYKNHGTKPRGYKNVAIMPGEWYDEIH
jgi:hypothetical protein